MAPDLSHPPSESLLQRKPRQRPRSGRQGALWRAATPTYSWSWKVSDCFPDWGPLPPGPVTLGPHLTFLLACWSSLWGRASGNCESCLLPGRTWNCPPGARTSHRKSAGHQGRRARVQSLHPIPPQQEAGLQLCIVRTLQQPFGSV